MGRFRSTTKALERWGAMSFDRIEALQISADQTKVGAHIATKNHLIEIDKRSQRDDDAEAIFYEKGLASNLKWVRLSGPSAGPNVGPSAGQKRKRQE